MLHPQDQIPQKPPIWPQPHRSFKGKSLVTALGAAIREVGMGTDRAAASRARHMRVIRELSQTNRAEIPPFRRQEPMAAKANAGHEKVAKSLPD
jgi:hypothetical protein